MRGKQTFHPTSCNCIQTSGEHKYPNSRHTEMTEFAIMKLLFSDAMLRRYGIRWASGVGVSIRVEGCQ